MKKEPCAFDARPNLVFGLVGPLGTDIETLQVVLREEVERTGYNVHSVVVSELIKRTPYYSGSDEAREDKRIAKLMDAGTRVRKSKSSGDALAILMIDEIRLLKDKIRDGDREVHAQAFIIRSLKHPDEVNKLRDTYGDSFFLISAYSPREARVATLARKIADTYGEASANRHADSAHSLVQKDEQEENEKLGQDVTEAFPLADIFIDVTARNVIENQIRRFVDIIFGYQFHTPSVVESGMFYAAAASMRSADLSRQVGAAISNDQGDILTVGCNEVPKSGGGQYWAGEKDVREFQKGIDSSSAFKRRIIKQIIQRFSDRSEHFEIPDNEVDTFVDDLITGSKRDILAGTQVMNLLEFGRVIHAEMAAISDAARRGIALQNSTLYCTTFPCHMCARHIISSGLRRVIYIEPYPKSVSHELYGDSALFDTPSASYRRNGDTWSHVSFEAFVGIAPRRYLEFFRMTKRKGSDGKVVKWNRSGAVPHIKIRERHIRSLEEECRQSAMNLRDSTKFDAESAKFLQS